MKTTRSIAIGVALLAAAAVAHAAPPTKEECLAAHSSGQDLRDKGRLADARKQFILCAQSACPALVQGDCARLGDEIEKTLPSVSFAARDAKGNDLANASVFVDDKFVTNRLDDGKTYDVDPGRHAIRFIYEGKTTTTKVVISQGEKGRVLLGTFSDVNGESEPAAKPSGTPGAGAAATAKDTGGGSRPIFPLVLAGVGVAALGTGLVLTVVGLNKVPSRCSTSSHDCSAPPGDPVFDDAKSAVGLANVGLVVGGIGAAAAVGGLIWYFASSPERSSVQVGMAPTNGGLSLSLGGAL